MNVNLLVTPTMLRAIEDAIHDPNASQVQIVRWKKNLQKPIKIHALVPELAKSPLNPNLNDEEQETTPLRIPFEIISEIHAFLRKHNQTYRNLYLHELLANSTYMPSQAPVVKKTAEEQARFEQVKARVESKLYSDMTQGISSNRESNIWAAKNLSVSKLTANLIVSSLTVATICYFLFSKYGSDNRIAICAAVIGSLLMFLIEAVLFVIYSSRLESRHLRENNPKSNFLR